LIELLVVIAIIAILASMLLPAFSRGKRQSKVTVCLNNMHHIGVAMEYFVTDHGAYPFNGTLGGHEVAREFVCPKETEEARLTEPRSRILYPYIKPSETFRCPEDKGLDFSPDFDSGGRGFESCPVRVANCSR